MVDKENKSSATLKTHLKQLYDRHISDLPPHVWMSEADRWAELVYFLLRQCSKQEPELLRNIVSTLQDLGVLKIDKLSIPAKSTDAPTVVLNHVLKQHGISNEEIQRFLSILTRVTYVVQKDYGGKIQFYLRRHGEALRDELVKAFSNDAAAEKQMRIAITHWLQNGLSLPISQEQQAIKEYCDKYGNSVEALWEAADELDINFAVVDDLMELERKVKESGSGDPVSESKGRVSG